MCDRAEAWLVEHKEELKVAEERRCSFPLILFPHFFSPGDFPSKFLSFFPQIFIFSPKFLRKLEERLEIRRKQREAQAILDEIKRIEDEKLAEEMALKKLEEDNEREEIAAEYRRQKSIKDAEEKLAKKEGKQKRRL